MPFSCVGMKKVSQKGIQIASHIANRLYKDLLEHQGGVILMHDIYDWTIPITEALIQKIQKEKKFSFASAEELMASKYK